ncbi:hypothetical protein AVEN_241984-1 [Araneus ventricosus]|uniref:Endonuclease/exonuclease/phosphatase domain-containing protein n=1 Tax=Araneus ventricosus TaxID=182803 RepID=A0A4Y2E9C1_ARAVE|nr:hypothetical protein AVEN_241984-1 [Araneus ventricosus]
METVYLGRYHSVFMDLKTFMPKFVKKLYKTLHDQETFSDHRLLLTEVNFQKTGRTERRKILKLQDMKILDFKRDLKELINTFSEADITSENLEDYIDKFYEGIYPICEINHKKISENKRKNAIWWNSNLEIKRREGDFKQLWILKKELPGGSFTKEN